jgi:hypothetical protein
VRKGVSATGVPGHQVSTTKPGFALANTESTTSVSPTRTHHLPALPYSAVSHGTPKTELRTLNARFWVWGLNPTPQPRVGKWADPLGASVLSTCTHHLRPSFHTTVSHSVSEIELQTLGFGFWLKPPPPPGLALANAQSPPSPPCHPPAPSTSRHCSTPPFCTARPKLSQKRSVLGFGPNTNPWPRVGECADPMTPLCYAPAPTTSHHCSTPPFRTACPKPSQKHSVLGFGPNPASPASHWQTHSPPPPAASATSPQHSPSPPPLSFRTARPKPSFAGQFLAGYLHTLSPFVPTLSALPTASIPAHPTPNESPQRVCDAPHRSFTKPSPGGSNLFPPIFFLSPIRFYSY